MLFNDAKEIYKEVENMLLSVSDNETSMRNDVFAPLKIILFTIARTNYWQIFLRFLIYFILISIIFLFVQFVFRGLIPELYLFFSVPLMLFIPSLLSIIAPPSEASFLRTNDYTINDVAEIIKRKRRRKNYALSDYLSGLREILQIVEKHTERRNLLIRTLLTVIYIAGVYVVGVVEKVNNQNGSFLLFSAGCFFIFFMFAECHNSFKNQIFGVLYPVIAELSFEAKEKPFRDTGYLINSKEMD